jgi:hypothetical protein
MNSNKLIIGKYQILSRILSEIDSLPQDILRQTLPFTVQGLTHSLQDVRQPASRCIVELYRSLGTEVRNHFGDLRQAQIAQIEAQLAEVDGGKGLKQRTSEEQKVEIISTNINPKGANAKEKSIMKPTKSEKAPQKSQLAKPAVQQSS